MAKEDEHGEDDDAGPRWTSTAASLAALVAYCAMDDYGVLHGEFTARDTEYVLNNQIVQGGLNWTDSIMTRDARGDPLDAPHSLQEFRPITTLSFRANALFSDGKETFPYHLTNLVLHVAITFMVGLTLGGLVFGHRRFTATFAATLAFATHPVHVEAVANIAGRDELLMAFFYLAGLLWYHRWAGDASRLTPALIGHAGATVMMALSTFSKESGLTLGLAVSFYELAQSAKSDDHPRRHEPQTMRNLALIAVWSGVVCYLRTGFLGLDVFSAPISPESNAIGTARRDPLTLALSSSWLFCLYVKDLFYPDYRSYSVDWSGASVAPVSRLDDPRCMYIGAFWATLALMSIGSMFSNGRTRRLWLLGFGALTMAPFLLYSNLLVPAEHTKADRFLYLPSVGTCILLGLACERLWSFPKRFGKVGLAAFYIVLVPGCVLWVSALYQRNTLWSSPLRVWQLSLSNNPGSSSVRINAARQMRQTGSANAAEVLLRPLVSKSASAEVLTLYATVASEVGNCTYVARYLEDAVEKANKELEGFISASADLTKARRLLSDLLTAKGLCMTLHDIPAAGKILYAAAVADPTNAFALEQGSNLLLRVELMNMQVARQQQQQQLQAQVQNLLKNSAPQMV